MDPVSLGLMGVDLVTSGINFVRGRKDKAAAEAALGAMGDAPNYTLSSDYDRMVNMALNAPQTGQSMAERAFGDQAAAAASFGSRGLGSLNAASRNLATTSADLEAQRLQSIQGALGTRAAAAQQVSDANVLRGQQTYDIERDRLLAEKAASQEAINAGISGFTNLGGGLLSGVGGMLSSDTTFGEGMQAFLNPSQANFSGSDLSKLSLDEFLALKARQTGQKAQGAKTNYKDVPLLRQGDSIVTEGPEDHDKLEYLIARMVKTSNGVELEPVARSTGKERHQVNEDGELTITNSEQEKSLQDSYERFKKTGDWKIPIRAMKNIFEKARFKD